MFCASRDSPYRLASPGKTSGLFSHNEVRPAILLVTLFGRSSAERLFLAVADCFHAIGRDTQGHQELLCRRRAPVAQSQVVLRRTALVAMTFDNNFQLRI